ncbi:family 1 glycosylhydrolase [Kocuria sabuli]|uniref:family 1 glycosylhydrolase n=1 Tax=Kocuria sabuli TaxID=3071448 RepID=UPI0034D5EAD8
MGVLKDHLVLCGTALQNGVQVSGDSMWGCIGLVGAAAAPMSKRYGFVCVDHADEDTRAPARCPRLSLDRCAEVIRTDGASPTR